jgi:hypothetical protein
VVDPVGDGDGDGDGVGLRLGSGSLPVEQRCENAVRNGLATVCFTVHNGATGAIRLTSSTCSVRSLGRFGITTATAIAAPAVVAG